MNNFRVHFTDALHNPEDCAFRIEVIGLHQKVRKKYSNFVPAWRLMMFHGKVHVKCNKKQHITQANTLFIFPPELGIEYADIQNATHSWLRVSGREVPLLIKNANLPVNTPICFPQSASESDNWLTSLKDELTRPDRNESILKDIFKIWLKYIARYADTPPRIPDQYLIIKNILDTQYTKKHSLENLSSKLNVSKEHFCLEFKKYFFISPIEYLIRLRLCYATELLEDATLNISEIAHLCGYEDIYYFSRLFKKRYGKSPKKYRESLLAQLS